MDLFNAILQAIVQGLTEFLPVSSSGHLVLTQYFTNTTQETGALFIVILHIGTLAAVCVAFHKLLLSLIIEFGHMIKDIFTGRFSFKNRSPERNMILMLLIACLPLIPVYPFKDFFVSIAENRKYIVVVGVCFLITAVFLFLADRCVKGKKDIGDINIRNSVTIGIFLAIALLPGVSRSGSTISAGLFCGLSRQTAVEFSFILGIPAILGGALSEIGDIKESAAIGALPIIIGLVVSAVVGFFAIKLVNWLLKTEKFKVFYIYMTAIGIFTVIIGIYELFSGKAL